MAQESLTLKKTLNHSFKAVLFGFSLKIFPKKYNEEWHVSHPLFLPPVLQKYLKVAPGRHHVYQQEYQKDDVTN